MQKDFAAAHISGPVTESVLMRRRFQFHVGASSPLEQLSALYREHVNV